MLALTTLVTVSNTGHVAHRSEIVKHLSVHYVPENYNIHRLLVRPNPRCVMPMIILFRRAITNYYC